jgi:hypothetical protein
LVVLNKQVVVRVLDRSRMIWTCRKRAKKLRNSYKIETNADTILKTITKNMVLMKIFECNKN